MSDLNSLHRDYQSSSDDLISLLEGIISAGEITEENKQQLDGLISKKDSDLIELQKEIDVVEKANNDSQMNYLTNKLIDLENRFVTSDNDIVSRVNGLSIDGEVMEEKYSEVKQTADGLITTVNGLDGRVSTVEQTANGLTTTVNGLDGRVTQAQQTADKYSWLIKSGTSASNMELTDKMYQLTTEKAMISAKQIELNGSININGGTFKVDTNGNMTANKGTFNGDITSGSTITGATIKNSSENPTFHVTSNGNMKIGGLTGHTVDGYERGQFEVTSSGTVYSVSPDDDGAYTKITEGKVHTYNGSSSSTIEGGTVTTYDVVANAMTNRNGSGVSLEAKSGSTSRMVSMRVSSGAGYFDPSSTEDEIRLGSTNGLWKVAYIVEGVKNSSDRTVKENIHYLYNTDGISTSDCLDFIISDYALATYNYINDEDKKTRLSAIAQDLLVNEDGSDNVIGQLIVDAEESASNNSILTMNQTQLLNVAIGAIQELSKEIQELKRRLGEE